MPLKKGLELEQGSTNDKRKEKEAFIASPKELLNEIGVLRDSLCNNMSEFDSETSSVVSEVFEMMDLIESKWAHDSDPDIEQDFVDLIKDEEFNNTFHMVRRVSEKLLTSASTLSVLC